jgi:hypothetical protein
MLTYNESISVCAQNENPFVENKPYNPDHVLGWIITHLLEGFYPANADEADYLKQLYIATIQLLMEKQIPVNEQSIVTMRDEIKAFLEADCSEVATPSETSPRAITDALTKIGYSTTGQDYRFDAMGKSLTVKKYYIHIAVVVLIILLLIKFLK